MLALPKHNRYPYSPIDERPDYVWPGGKRLAFCVTTNIEVYSLRIQSADLRSYPCARRRSRGSNHRFKFTFKAHKTA